MGNSNVEPAPPDGLSVTLTRRTDALEPPELHSLPSSIAQRINALRTSIEEETEVSATGDALGTETRGADAIVRKHPPDPDADGVNAEVTSPHHVRREPRLDGTDPLHGACPGEVHNPARPRRGTCGRTLDEDVDICPQCGSDGADHSDPVE